MIGELELDDHINRLKKYPELSSESLLKKYNLSKKETIFFDDKDKNVQAAKEVGIKGIKFKSVNDIKNNL